MKKLFIFLLLMISFGLVSCKKSDKNKNPSSTETTPQIVLNFTQLVEKIGTVSLESKDAINSAHYFYLGLNDEYKNNEKTKLAYQKLLIKIDEYNQIYEEMLVAANDQKLADAFISYMSELNEPSDIILEDEPKITKAKQMYDNLSDNAKQKVNSAHIKLQDIVNRLDYLKSLDANAYDKEIFIVKVNRNYESIDTITLDKKEEIDELKNLYNNFSLATKVEEEVKTAYEKLSALDAKMNILVSEQKTTEEFLNKVYALPTYDNLRYKDSNQAKQINDCISYYQTLSDNQKKQTSVINAYKELLNIKNTFESLQEPYDITVCGTLNFYNNESNQKTPIQALMQKYNYTSETLKENMRVYLNFYIEGGAQAGNPFYQLDITEKDTISAAEVRAILASLSGTEGYEKVTNGEHYCFTFKIESLNDQYGNSYYSDFFSRMVISW